MQFLHRNWENSSIFIKPRLPSSADTCNQGYHKHNFAGYQMFQQPCPYVAHGHIHLRLAFLQSTGLTRRPSRPQTSISSVLPQTQRVKYPASLSNQGGISISFTTSGESVLSYHILSHLLAHPRNWRLILSKSKGRQSFEADHLFIAA